MQVFTSSWRKKSGFLLAVVFFLTTNLWSYNSEVTSTAKNNKCSGKENLEMGIFSYEHGDYDKALLFLNKAVNCEKSLNVNYRKKLYVTLGVIWYIKKKMKKSKKFFLKVLELDPEYSIDPLFYPPEIVLFFNEIKNQRSKLLSSVGVTFTTKKNPAFLNFVKRATVVLPFGLNYSFTGKKKKAWIFGTIQAFLLAVNVSFYYYRVCNLKSCGDKYYPLENVSEAKALQVIQLTAGYGWLGLWIYNIVDVVEGK